MLLDVIAKRVDAGVRAHTQWLRADKDALSLDTGDVLVLQMLILVVIENRIVDAVVLIASGLRLGGAAAGTRAVGARRREQGRCRRLGWEAN